MYTPRHLSQRLQEVLPSHWLCSISSGIQQTSTQEHPSGSRPFSRPRGIGLLGNMLSQPTGRGTGEAASALVPAGGGLGVSWDNGSQEGPSPWWLQRMWELVAGLMEAGGTWEATRCHLCTHLI